MALRIALNLALFARVNRLTILVVLFIDSFLDVFESLVHLEGDVLGLIFHLLGELGMFIDVRIRMLAESLHQNHA